MKALQQNTSENQIILTLGEVIFRLNGQCLERQHAFTAYAKKYTCYAKQLAAIEEITLLLSHAARATGDRERISLIIRTQPKFLFIAPRSTQKLFNTYYAKLHELFMFCHHIKERMVKTA